jgi:hypothetical protein
MATPAQRFRAGAPTGVPAHSPATNPDRSGDDLVSPRVTTNGVVCVSWQQVSIGRYYAGQRCDVHVDGDLMRLWVGDQLVKTAARRTIGEVQIKRAMRTSMGCLAG